MEIMTGFDVGHETAEAGYLTDIGICSSHGNATFDAAGRIIEQDDELVEVYGAFLQLDICEWMARYPGEKPFGKEHDILDFGIWIDDGKEGEYMGPEEGWRQDRELASRDELKAEESV